MRINRPKAILGLVIVASVILSIIPPAEGGPIGDMIARYRQNRAMKLPPKQKPFSHEPVKDLSVKQSSFTNRLKKRFTFKKPATSGVIPFQDREVSRASQ